MKLLRIVSATSEDLRDATTKIQTPVDPLSEALNAPDQVNRRIIEHQRTRVPESRPTPARPAGTPEPPNMSELIKERNK